MIGSDLKDFWGGNTVDHHWNRKLTSFFKKQPSCVPMLHPPTLKGSDISLREVMTPPGMLCK